MDSARKDDLMGRLMTTFAGEADERIKTMSRDVLMLEGSTDPVTVKRLVDGLFREAHSLKGAARAVDLEPIAALAHRLESLLELLRSDELQPEPPVCDVIHRVLDALAALAREATTGEAADVDSDALMAMLDDPRRGVVDRPRIAEVAPTPVRPEEPAGSRVSPAPARRETTDSVRVATSKLDALLAGVGELVVSQAGVKQDVSELRTLAEELEAWERRWRRTRSESHEDRGRLRTVRSRVVDLHRRLQAGGRRVAEATAGLDEEVRRSRMLPVATMLDAFPRMVRDIAREQGKEVAFVISGAETEVDRFLLEQLTAPLTHIVRNSVGHGVEDPDVRSLTGKPRQATVTISVSQHGGTLAIDVSDDGAGIDADRVRASAVQAGLIGREAADAMGDRDAIGLIFRSGFSTAAIISDLSGRGVGLDVVRESIEHLHGTIDVDTRPGTGTRLSLRLPLSVSTTQCLLVRAATQSFALPTTSVIRIVRVAPSEIDWIEGREVLRSEGRIVPLARLAAVLDVGEPEGTNAPGPYPAILIGSADRVTAFLVDELIGLQELVTRALPPPFVRVRHLAGCAVLGTGGVVPILNAPDLVRTASPRQHADVPPPAEPGVGVVLVAEDSQTTRTLMTSILETAGYEVRAAQDGEEAWNIVRGGGIDLVVADVEMPHMGGFELTTRIRADERIRHLPVILVTARDSRQDLDRGVAVGANAYFSKNSFEQGRLLEAIQQLL